MLLSCLISNSVLSCPCQSLSKLGHHTLKKTNKLIGIVWCLRSSIAELVFNCKLDKHYIWFKVIDWNVFGSKFPELRTSIQLLNYKVIFKKQYWASLPFNYFLSVFFNIYKQEDISHCQKFSWYLHFHWNWLQMLAEM